MNNIDARWIKEIIIAVVLGFLSGELVSKLLGLVLRGGQWELFLSCFVPLFMVGGLLIVLMRYTKEEDDIINGNSNE